MWPVEGHEWAVELLTRSIETGRLRHAYLLVGPSRIGKTALAKAFAQTLLCREAQAPCGVCRSCRLVQAVRHPDVLFVAPEQGRIKIEAIRVLQRAVALSPVEANRRVCIITHTEAATPSAANCLLKTLEEPPSGVVLVLTASRTDLLLPTLVSRCQVFGLRPLSAEQIAAALQSRGVPQEKARFLAQLAQGRIGWALEAATDADLFDRRTQVFAELAELVAGSCTARFAWAEEQSRQPDDLPELLETLASWWRDVLLLASGSHAAIANVDRHEELVDWAAQYGVSGARSALRNIRETAWRLEHNANVRLALEVMALEMPGSPWNGN